jgi:hypothetical protein
LSEPVSNRVSRLPNLDIEPTDIDVDFFKFEERFTILFIGVFEDESDIETVIGVGMFRTEVNVEET